MEKIVSLKEAISDIAGYDIVMSDYQIESRYGRTKNIITKLPISTKELFNNDYSCHYKYIEERFSLLKEGESNLQLRKRLIKKGIDIEKYPELLKYLINKLSVSKEEIIKKCKVLSNDSEILDLIVTKKIHE